MKTKEALKLLASSLQGNDFTFHVKFIHELSELLCNDLKGKESKFFKCLETQLQNIRDHRARIHLVDGHEQLKGFDGHYYSIHVQNSNFNIRLLIHIDDDNSISFLCAFYERGGHANTNYEKHKPVLMPRLQELKGGN